MSNGRVVFGLLSAAALAGSLGGGVTARRPAPPSAFTLDDEMKMRAIVDVRIAPDGMRVAYVVSTPSVERNEHQSALFYVPAGGGVPTRLGEGVRIYTPTVPRPQLRWSPDGRAVSVTGLAGDRPQVFAIPLSGETPRALTAAPEGVFGYEWSSDGTSLAYLTRDPMTPDEARRRQDKSFVIQADAPDPATRLVVQRLDGTLRPFDPSTSSGSSRARSRDDKLGVVPSRVEGRQAQGGPAQDEPFPLLSSRGQRIGGYRVTLAERKTAV